MKRRGHGEGTLYQRADGHWRAMLDLGWRDGRRIRRSVSGPTRREVVDKLKAARRSVDAGVEPPSDRLTVAVYLADWLDATRSTVRPSTWIRYRGMVERTTSRGSDASRYRSSPPATWSACCAAWPMPGCRLGPVTTQGPSCEPGSLAPWRMG